MSRSGHTVLLALRLFLALLIALPAPMAVASGPESLVCSPSGQPLSASAQAQLDALEATLGVLSGEEDAPSSQHCEDCLQSFLALEKRSSNFGPSVDLTKTVSPTRTSTLIQSPRGPPLGGRAPPLFR